MKKFSKHTPEQIVAKLDKARSMKASGSTVAEVCRDLGVSEATYRRWVKQYGEMSRSEACRFKELQEENAKLTRLLGEAELEKPLLKGACGGKKSFPGTQIMKPSMTLYPWAIRCALPVAWSGSLERHTTTPAHTTSSPAWISTLLYAGGSSLSLVSTDAGAIAALG
ncbi:transposase [Corynebacterium accolens]|uniref:Transposase n=1 Tax=Corynebacterium accolens TaxID=38284 RepID=A0AAP4F9C8_9CORY|nr:transposase [Corynebacterium accolens]MDK4335871.1 transposase [Corynebacterium accolens]